MILCCGESLIDMIPVKGENGAQAFEPHSGGSVFNTAISLGRLGADVGFLSGMSSDLFGEQLRQTLEESHVNTNMAIISDRPTTLAFVQLNDGQATYTFYDENSAGRSLIPDDLPQIPADFSTLYFGGISLIGEPCADFYKALALRESSNKIIMLDPNIRAGFITDEQRYRARLNEMITCADIVKISDEDLNWISKEPIELIDKARAVLSMGPNIIILTKGAEGAVALSSNGDEVEVSAPKIEVVDTVGAGDTFNAGVLAKLAVNNLLTKEVLNGIGGEALEQAVRYGTQVAAITVSRSGADSPWARELEIEH